MPAAETARLVAELTLKDKMSAGLRKADSNLKAFDKSTANTQKSLGKFAGNVGKAFAVAGAATVAAGVVVVNAASDYESAFAGVRKTVNASEQDLNKLSDAFRQMAKTIPISASELAALGETAGALGIEGVDNIQEFVRVTALLGETTNLTSQEAADSLGVISNVLHLTSKEYSQFASALVALGNAGASTESQIIDIAQRAGSAGELIGLTTEQVLALSSSVASLGIETEAGGSALQKFFLDSSKAIVGGGKDLKVFAKVAGQSAKTFQKSFKQDAGKALQQFLAGLGKLPQAQQLKVLEQLGFNDVRITRTLLGLAGNTALVADQMEVANDAFRENTALTKEADQRNKTFASQMQITKNVLTDIAITIGSKLLPKITPLLQRFNAFVSQNQGKIEKFGDDLAKAFGDIADSIAKVDWKPFIDGLKFTADVARAAIGAFQSLPDGLQKLIIAGVAANKLTGGLVTSVGKDLIGAIGGQFLSRGSSPANPLWVQQVGGGGLPGAVGGAAAGLGGAAVGVGLTGLAIIGGIQGALVSAAGQIAGEVGKQIQSTVGAGPLNVFGPFQRLIDVFQGDMRSPLEKIEQSTKVLGPKVDTLRGDTTQGQTRIKERLESIRNLQSTANAKRIADSGAERALAARAIAEQARTTHAAQQSAAAIRDKKLSVKVNNQVVVNNKVWVGETIKAQTTFKKLGGFVS